MKSEGGIAMLKRLINCCVSSFAVAVASISFINIYVDINTLLFVFNKICVNLSHIYNSFITFKGQLENNIYVHAIVGGCVIFLLPILLFGSIFALMVYLDD